MWKNDVGFGGEHFASTGLSLPRAGRYSSHFGLSRGIGVCVCVCLCWIYLGLNGDRWRSGLESIGWCPALRLTERFFDLSSGEDGLLCLMFLFVDDTIGSIYAMS